MFAVHAEPQKLRKLHHLRIYHFMHFWWLTALCRALRAFVLDGRARSEPCAQVCSFEGKALWLTIPPTTTTHLHMR